MRVCFKQVVQMALALWNLGKMVLLSGRVKVEVEDIKI
jgi:hypothetical protein